MAVITEGYNLRIFGGQISPPGGASNYSLTGHILVSDVYGRMTDKRLFLIYVTTPPAHGYITLSGSPTSQFTQDDLDHFRVDYHAAGAAIVNDTFAVTAVPLSVPGVAIPYTPRFFEQDFSSSFPGDTPDPDVGWISVGVMMDGAGGVPPLMTDEQDGSYFGPIGGATTYSFPVTVGHPNSVILISSMTINVVHPGSTPPASVVTSITCPGLTFSRLSGASITRNHVEGDGSAPHQWVGTSTLEVWWAYAPSVIISSTTATIHWSPATSSNGEQWVWYSAYTGAANPAAPFDTGSGNFAVTTGDHTSMPVMALPMTPSAQDAGVAVIYYGMAVNGYVAETGIYPPNGYWGQTGGGGGGGVVFTESLYKRSQGHITIPVMPSYPPVLTDSELVFEPLGGFMDLGVEANRRHFVSLNGTPAWMGGHGEIPFGTPPAVYLTTQGPPLNFAQNNGSGGGFAPTPPVDPHDGPGCSPYYVTEAAGAAANPEWRLTTSDNGGRTWSTLVKPRSSGALGVYLTRLRWQKMGQSRQRMVRLECTDPVRRNIVGIYIDADQGMS